MLFIAYYRIDLAEELIQLQNLNSFIAFYKAEYQGMDCVISLNMFRQFYYHVFSTCGGAPLCSNHELYVCIIMSVKVIQ